MDDKEGSEYRRRWPAIFPSKLRIERPGTRVAVMGSKVIGHANDHPNRVTAIKVIFESTSTNMQVVEMEQSASDL